MRIVPSYRDGRHVGEWVEGEARILEGEDSARAMVLFKEEYGRVGFPVIGSVGKLRGKELTTVVAIELIG